MELSRFFMHPVLIHRRSRMILFFFSAAVLALSCFLWWNIAKVLEQAGINPQLFPSTPNRLLSLLLSFPFKLSVPVFTALFAGGLTAVQVVGPVKRIEQWLGDWEAGHHVSPLRVRSRDQYKVLIQLLNDLHIKSNPRTPITTVETEEILVGGPN